MPQFLCSQLDGLLNLVHRSLAAFLPDDAEGTKSSTPPAPAAFASAYNSPALMAETLLVKNKLATLCRNLLLSGYSQQKSFAFCETS